MTYNLRNLIVLTINLKNIRSYHLNEMSKLNLAWKMGYAILTLYKTLGGLECAEADTGELNPKSVHVFTAPCSKDSK